MNQRTWILAASIVLVACSAPPANTPPPSGGPPSTATSGVYVGRIADSDALIAIVVEDDGFAAYTCGGEDSWQLLTGWYSGTMTAGQIDGLSGTTGWHLNATRRDDRWSGTVTRLDQSFSFSAEPAAPGTAAGLYLLDTSTREAGLIIDNDLNTAGVYYGKRSGATSTVSVRDDLEADPTERETIRVDTSAYGGSTYTLERNERTFTRAMFTIELASSRVHLDRTRNATTHVTITPQHGFSGDVSLVWNDPAVTIAPSSVSLADGATTTFEALITLDPDTPVRALDAVLGASSGNLEQFEEAGLTLTALESWWHPDAYADAYATSEAWDIATNALGFSYVIGTVSNPVGEDLTEEGPFLARFNPDGARVWLRMLEGGTPRAVAHGPENTVYIAGEVAQGDADWSGEQPSGMRAAYVQRMTASGDVMWRVMFDHDGDDHMYWRAKQLAVDASGNAYLVGQASTPPSFSDVFVAKLSDLGTLLWTTTLDSGRQDFATDIAVDVAGKAYVSGRWNHLYVTEALPEPEDRGVGFLAKLDAGGEEQWMRLYDSAHGAGSGFGSVDLDPHGRPVVGGHYAYYVDDDPYHWTNGLVATYDQDGTLMWDASISSTGAGAPTRCWSSAHNTGAPACNAVHAVRIDASGSIYAFGHTSGWLEEAGENNAGTQDVFLAHYSPTGTQVWTNVFGSANGHDLPGSIVFWSGSSLDVDAEGNLYVAWVSPAGFHADDRRAAVRMLMP